VPRALGFPEYDADEAAAIARSHDAREPLPQVGRAAPAELRLVGEHPVHEVGAGTRPVARQAPRPELTRQPALEGFPSAVTHEFASGSQASPREGSSPPFPTVTSVTVEAPPTFFADSPTVTVAGVLRLPKPEISAPRLTCNACNGSEGGMEAPIRYWAQSGVRSDRR